MAEVKFAPATRFDAAFVADHLRDCDVQELTLSSGNPKRAVMRALEISEFSWTATEDGTPLCIFGVTEIGPGQGSPWLVGTDAMMRHRRKMLTEGRRFVQIMRKLYPCLYNFVYLENRASIAWLRAIGFQFGQPVPYGIRQQPFIPFYVTPDV